MNGKYLVTGYSKKDERMATRIFKEIEHVVELMTMCSKKTAKLSEANINTNSEIPSAKDLKFDVETRANHDSAAIVNTHDYCWSIFLIK